jgi:hypothetical protein
MLFGIILFNADEMKKIAYCILAGALIVSMIFSIVGYSWAKILFGIIVVIVCCFDLFDRIRRKD